MKHNSAAPSGVQLNSAVHPGIPDVRRSCACSGISGSLRSLLCLLLAFVLLFTWSVPAFADEGGATDPETPAPSPSPAPEEEEEESYTDYDYSGIGPASPYPIDGTVKIIVDFLRNDLGLNSAAVAGVLANIQNESEFNSNIYGDEGSAYGLCQWAGKRLQNLKNYCAAYNLDYTTVSAQLGFMYVEMTQNYAWTLRILRGCKNDADGADSASYAFCLYYEVPRNIRQELSERSKLAVDGYFPILAEHDVPVEGISQEEAKIVIADFLRNEMHFNNAVTAGIMANIDHESQFNPLAVGDRSTAFGICQWGYTRRKTFTKYCKKNSLDEDDIMSQLQFMQYELENYYPDTMLILRKLQNTEEGAEVAAYYFCKNYEVPKKMDYELTSRKSDARLIYFPELNNPSEVVKEEAANPDVSGEAETT